MSKKTLTFLVTIEFADSITSDKHIKEVATNVAEAIVDATNGQGIAPSDGDTYSTHVKVEPLNVDLKFKVERTIV